MSSSSGPFLPWLRLARLPAVFTALADIFAGFLLTHTSWQPQSEFISLIAASACLYLSGMVLNDVFDLKQDRIERPTRPIPAGEIDFIPAVLFGTVLMAIGLIAAFMAGPQSLTVGLLLAVAILIYDGGLKRTLLGPVSMGLCRTLNILLGASSGAAEFSGIWGMPQLWIAVAMGIYITGVTWFARTEEKVSHRGTLISGLVLINLGLVMLLFWMLDLPAQWGIDLGPVGTSDLTPMLIFWSLVTLLLNRRALTAIAKPVPGNVQPTIGTLLLSIITINAMIISFRLGPSGMEYAIMTLLLIAPAILLKRFIPMT